MMKPTRLVLSIYVVALVQLLTAWLGFSVSRDYLIEPPGRVGQGGWEVFAAQHVAFDAEERVYASLHRDAHVDVWLLCWTPENDTGWHDHDISSGAVAVVAGELVENNLTVASGAMETRIGAGKAYSFGPEHIHRLNGAEPGSVSVHAYSPPLWRMGQYAVSEAGVLRRVSVSYADELRPID